MKVEVQDEAKKAVLVEMLTNEDASWLLDNLKQLDGCGNHYDREDLVQTTLYEVLKAIEGKKVVYQEGESPRDALWKLSVTVFNCRKKNFQKHQCRQYVKRIVSLERMRADEKGGGKAMIEGIADPRPRMRREQLSRETLIDCCLEAVALLDATASKVLLMKLASEEDITNEENALELDITHRSVRRALERAKKVVLSLYAERLTR